MSESQLILAEPSILSILQISNHYIN
ncbi:hypothetical protein VIBNIPon4_630001 [Vibrio nigripulchritudo POn4]|nr:hypothetical protein VIBNIAM115_650001 [Vibrio nigripulchritudo AM115]CCN66783.1 hypothetical protein VIBNIPon4_630001 [Vibrio nigripulchritudo POn4]